MVSKLYKSVEALNNPFPKRISRISWKFLVINCLLLLSSSGSFLKAPGLFPLNVFVTWKKPSSPKDMGLIMREVTPKLKGKADMAKVSSMIKERLANL